MRTRGVAIQAIFNESETCGFSISLLGRSLMLALQTLTALLSLLHGTRVGSYESTDTVTAADSIAITDSCSSHRQGPIREHVAYLYQNHPL